MNRSPELALVDPKNLAPLRSGEDGKDWSSEEHRYPVIDGVPDLRPEAARPIDGNDD